MKKKLPLKTETVSTENRVCIFVVGTIPIDLLSDIARVVMKWDKQAVLLGLLHPLCREHDANIGFELDYMRKGKRGTPGGVRPGV